MDITFHGGLLEPVHSWFRLTPSYSPALVRYMLGRMGYNDETVVLDPFLGKGTTAIECKRLGINCTGIEINPLLYTVSDYSLTWDVDLGLFRADYTGFYDELSGIIDRERGVCIGDVLARHGLVIPPIHNPYRWWRRDVLRDLLLIKRAVFGVCDVVFRRLYWLALCSSVLDCANIHRQHPTITFDDGHTREIDVLSDFNDKVERIISDLGVLHRRHMGTYPVIEVLHGDSTVLDCILGDRDIDRVLTSPPYPNRFSYVQTTRAQLFFMDIFDRASQSGDLDLASIGGTWGRATSALQGVTLEPGLYSSGVLGGVLGPLADRSRLMYNYVVKYFNMLDAHIRGLRCVVGDGIRGVYIIGNSRLQGIDIDVAGVLQDIMRIHGFRVVHVETLRRRRGGRGLYESGLHFAL